MDNQIFDHEGIRYERGDMYPATTKFYIAKLHPHQDRYDIDSNLEFDSLDDLCASDWYQYCKRAYWASSVNWPDDYVAEWEMLPLHVVECHADGSMQRFVLQGQGPADAQKYCATSYGGSDYELLKACHRESIINLLSSGSI